MSARSFVPRRNNFSAATVLRKHYGALPVLVNDDTQNQHYGSAPSEMPSDHVIAKSHVASIKDVTLPQSFSSFSRKYEYHAGKLGFSSGALDFDEKLLHLEIIKNGFAGDLFLCNTVINLYFKGGNMVAAREVFDEMPYRNLVTWSCLISGYTQNQMPVEACEAFSRMISLGFIPNHYAVGSALRACQSLGGLGLRLGMQIHGLVSKTRNAYDVVISNVLISMYGSYEGNEEYARRIFDGIMVKNSISWNSIISVHSKRGDVLSAFELFSQMQKEGTTYSLRPNAFTFSSLITSISSSSSLVTMPFLLDQMLATVQKSGFFQDLYVGSALVSAFARFGLLDISKKIFKQMGVKNAVSLNGLMVGLVRLKRGEEAAEIFMELRESVRINSDSYAVLLNALTEISFSNEALKRGKELHGHLIRSGLSNTNVAIGNGLIHMYFKCSEVEDAISVFMLMADRDSVSWNSIIAGFDQNEYFEDALLTFLEMKKSGFKVSNFTLISTLSSCGSLGWKRMGQQLHGEGIKYGLDMDVSVCNALLSTYAVTGSLTECKRVFSSMPEYDQVSWNSMIGASSEFEESVSEAVGYFKQMMLGGWRLNKVTFINVLTAISSLSLPQLAYQVHALGYKYKVIEDSAVENALISCYGKCGQMNDCEIIFSRMSCRKDDASWNNMIASYIHTDLLPKAMDLVSLMLQNGHRLDTFTFATVLSACASVATLERGMEVHACGTRASLELDIVVGSALVDMYAKCGRIDYASRFFELMPTKNLYTWNSMICGYARHGDGCNALELFKKMKFTGLLPDHVTFVGVLSACSHMGMVDQGFYHFEAMRKDYGIDPCIEHFSCMVDLLGRAGELEKIEDFINKMPLKPNILIWRTVLGACSRANGLKTDLGRRAAKMLFELEPGNAVNYVLLGNMYASGGNWEGVVKARHAMREATLRKEVGCSWVTMKDGLHIFVAGDKSHPKKDAIYEKLRELHLKIKIAGYVPQLNFALYDLEVENKEEILSHHSERLAIAFVLTHKSELPIRIMKNLRVCGDCHSAFKYISQVVQRQIILRDSNRFHHFSGGKCSCNDYW